jgi:hypothetical protein
MASENEEQDQPEYKRFTVAMMIKAMAILFVVAIYIVIFLKILLLQ